MIYLTEAMSCISVMTLFAKLSLIFPLSHQRDFEALKLQKNINEVLNFSIKKTNLNKYVKLNS